MKLAKNNVTFFVCFIIAIMQPTRCSLERQSREKLAENELLQMIADKVRRAISLSSQSKGRFFKDSQSFDLKHAVQTSNQGFNKHRSYENSHSREVNMSVKTQCQDKQSECPSSWTQIGTKIQPENSKKSIVKQQLVWNNFKLIPNANAYFQNFTCGKCKNAFLKIDEFIFHCIEFCTNIDHNGSSHFIVTQNYSSKIGQTVNRSTMIDKSDDMEKSFWHSHPRQSKFDKIEYQTNWINKRIQTIKNESKYIIHLWKKMKLQKQFVYDRQYRLICPSFIFAVNPFSNLRKITEPSPTCKKNSSARNLICSFHQHFIKQCCKVNTYQSAFLILWSEEFYRYLYQTRKENILPKENDIGYTKYLYQKTPLKQQIDILHPRFKYYLGYYQAYIFFCGIHELCQFCGFQIPGKFIRYYYKKNHDQTCIVTSEPQKLFRVKIAKKTPKQFNIGFMNIENICEYNFFCPCEPSKQISAPQLAKHLKSLHRDNMITIELIDSFKKEKRNQ